MARYPYVTQSQCHPDPSAVPIALGSPDWYTWLESAQHFSYRDAGGSFTARHEERAGGRYWYAYRRSQGRLRKRYLGRSQDLSPQHMRTVAAALSASTATAPPMPESAIIHTRLAIPQPPQALLPRPALIQQLTAALRSPCALIIAPAGFGKTTLLADACLHYQWRGWGIAWLSIGQGNREPAQFWRHVLASIERAAPGHTAQAAAALRRAPHAPPQGFLAPLINALAEHPGHILLALDDYHMADSPVISEGLLFLIQHMPASLRVAIASRSAPDIPLARLRAHGQVAELGHAALRLTPAESRQLLASAASTHLDEAQLAALEEQIEGWAAGVQLASLALATAATPAMALATLGSSGGYIGDYLMETVVADLPTTTRDFLLRTSILDQVCGPLGDAVAQTAQPGEAQAMLDTLERRGLFTSTLDSERRWFRYHHLLADMLRDLLARTPDLLAACHQRAARWHGQHGDRRSGIRHALDGHDPALAAALAQAEAPGALQSGALADLIGWWDALDNQAQAKHPLLAIYVALALFMRGENTRATQLLQQPALQPSAIPPQLRGHGAAIRAFSDLIQGGQMEAAHQIAREALRRLPPHEHLLIDIATIIVSTTQLTMQDAPDEAARRMSEVAHRSLGHGNLLIAAFALDNRIIKELSQGRLRQAERSCHEAIQLMADAGNAAGYTSWALLRLGTIYHEWDQPERALEHIERGLAAPHIQHPEIMVDGYITLARIHSQRGNKGRAYDTLAAIERWVYEQRVTPHTAWQIQALRARLDCRWGELPSATRWADRYQSEASGAASALSAFSDLTLARVRLDQGRYAEAAALLQQVLASAQAAGRAAAAIEAMALLALAAHAQGNDNDATAHLGRALAMAAPEQAMRTFLDEGQPLLVLLAGYAALANTPRAARSFALRLLGQAGAAAPPSHEPLSPREQQILQLLAKGMSNAAIAAQLFLATSTIKWHIAHLYQKIGVRTRGEAVAWSLRQRLPEPPG
ncbi:hypothetical protein F8S13_22935 [Chloroflexia bacterium SDU3-3]|nr:hypothetical protein F8S13_22935 [Chloroflexia bacterium SDU3-3]